MCLQKCVPLNQTTTPCSLFPQQVRCLLCLLDVHHLIVIKLLTQVSLCGTGVHSLTKEVLRHASVCIAQLPSPRIASSYEQPLTYMVIQARGSLIVSNAVAATIPSMSFSHLNPISLYICALYTCMQVLQMVHVPLGGWLQGLLLRLGQDPPCQMVQRVSLQ